MFDPVIDRLSGFAKAQIMNLPLRLESRDPELDTATHLYLAMRQQNLELLRIVTQVMCGEAKLSSLKPDERKQALDRIWDVYSEFQEWIDPEQADDDATE